MKTHSRRGFLGLLATAPVVPFVVAEAAPATVSHPVEVAARGFGDEFSKKMREMMDRQAAALEAKIIEGLQRGRYDLRAGKWR